MNPYKLPAEPWVSRILFRTEVGSTAHGTGLPGTEDYDEIAVMSEPLLSMVGLHSMPDTILHRPGRTNADRSGPGDWDLTVYSARKWAGLAAKGNPSILVSLFGPQVQANEFGLEVLNNPRWFWSDLARFRFLGYAKAQRERLVGIRGGAHTNRPELVETHGFDTKYAMHMVRLGFQGIEFIATGEIRLPMDDDRGDYLRAIRRGEIPKEQVILTADALEQQLKGMDGMAPPEPNYKEIDKWLLRLAKAELK